MTKPNHSFTVEQMNDYIRKNKLNKAPVLLKMNRNDKINALKKINHFDDIGKPRKTPTYNKPKQKPTTTFTATRPKSAGRIDVKKPVGSVMKSEKKATPVKKVKKVKKATPVKKADEDTLPYLASDPFDAISSKYKGDDLSKLSAKTFTEIVDIIKSSGYKISTSQIKKMKELWNNPLYKTAEFRHIKGTDARDKKLGNKGLVLTFFRQNYSQKEFRNPRLQFAKK